MIERDSGIGKMEILVLLRNTYLVSQFSPSPSSLVLKFQTIIPELTPTPSRSRRPFPRPLVNLHHRRFRLPWNRTRRRNSRRSIQSPPGHPPRNPPYILPNPRLLRRTSPSLRNDSSLRFSRIGNCEYA